MTASLIAQIKAGAQAALKANAQSCRAHRVVELCEEVERLQKESAMWKEQYELRGNEIQFRIDERVQLKGLIDMAAGALADCYDVKEWPADNECRQAVVLKALLASGQE